MKIKLIIVISVVLLGVGAAFYDMGRVPDFVPVIEQVSNENYKAAPDLPFSTMAGKEYTLYELKQPVILLHYWASWCASCIVEFPDLLEMVAKGNGAIALVAISIDDDRSDLDRFMVKINKKSPQYVDNKNVYWVHDVDKSLSLKAFNIGRVPETIVVGSGNLMVDKLVGETDWRSVLARYIK